MKKLWLATLLALVTSGAMAHEVWLERDGKNAQMFFGHWTRDMIENKDRLEMFKLDQLTPKNRVKKIERMEKSIKLELASEGDVALTEVMKPRKSRLTPEVVQRIFLARTGRSETKNLLKLDLVPSAKDSNKMKVVFDGKPLAKQMVKLYGPHKWSKEFRSDDEGMVILETPWKGGYFVDVRYTEEVKGEYEGVAFESKGYLLTLTFNVSEGIAWESAKK
ncbi:MAG: DUF4198 domain-containing protein [Wolinella sp.]